ncbi:hypothetical protein PIB30_092912 [Stylosanthes scabra]|uniref:Uncharacterized protein n=1 Tax=Stylosanthes scabra TaxID=79078 RepID=A0ABU6VX04_9FABA|nr:hypothetical protein [Stylosanthes scabra]
MDTTCIFTILRLVNGVGLLLHPLLLIFAVINPLSWDGRYFFINKLAVYGNRPFSVIGFSMHSGSWVELIIPDSSLHSFFSRLISNGHRLFLMDVDPCDLVYGLHSHEIVIMDDWKIQWGPSRLCPFAYISQTPTIMIDDMILGLIHSVSDADISDTAFQGALSEINFSIVDIDNR